MQGRELVGEPRIKLSNWHKWQSRSEFHGSRLPGIYVLAHFRSAPVGSADPLMKQIVYIGETTRRTLGKRWQQFDTCATNGNANHSGGKTYFEKFGPPKRNLFVAAFAVDNLDEPFRGPFILYAERRLLWKFVRRWGKLPRCNKK